MRLRLPFLALICVLTAGATAQTLPVPQIEVEVKEIDPFDYMCLESTGPYAPFQARLSAFLQEFNQLRIKPIGPLMTLYWNSPLVVKPEALRWDIGYAIGEGHASSGNLVVKRFAYPKVAMSVHRGPYATSYLTITALYGWLRNRGIKTFGGPCVEYYLDREPARVPDEKKTTLIAVPVRSGN